MAAESMTGQQLHALVNYNFRLVKQLMLAPLFVNWRSMYHNMRMN